MAEVTPYASNALAHFDKGWSVFPAAPGRKEPLVKGRSGGYKSEPVSRSVVEAELRKFAKANVGIRVPEDFVVLDIDRKVDEDTGEILLDGADAFSGLALPPTISVCHGPEDSEYRHHLYRAPEGVGANDIARLGASRSGIDLIRWMHRLTLGRGSLHKTGEVYRWATKAGTYSGGIPTPAHATRLSTEEWERVVDFFGTTSGSGSYSVADVDVDAWLEAHAGRPSAALKAAFTRHWTQRSSGRHDAVLRALAQVAHLSEEGEPGAAPVVERLRREFVEQVADRSSEDEALGEFERAFVSALGKAAAKTEAGDRVPEVTTIEMPRDRSRSRAAKVPVKDDGEPVAEDEPEVFEAEIGEEFSDSWVAEQVHAEWARRDLHVVYSPGMGWLRWNGKRWKPVPDEVVASAIQKHMMDWLAREVRDGVSSERRGRLGALLSKPRQERVMRALKVVEVVEATLFDADAALLNCPNGVVDLHTGVLMPHDPALMMTKITRAPYVKGATHPDWTKAKEVLDSERLSWLLGRFGQAITGYTPTDDKVVFLTGTGGNGKSTVVGPVLKALGSYATLVPATLLMGASDRHPAELMTLLGIRFALAEETPEEGRINVQRLKQIAGVDQLSARKMRQDFVVFDQTHSLFVTTNYPPSVVETDHGTWRRLARCKFERNFRGDGATEPDRYAFRGGAADESTDETLRQRVGRNPEVWVAVLADLVAQAVRHFEAEQAMESLPARIEADTMAWRSDMDPLIEFVSESLVDDEFAYISADELLGGFNEYARDKSMREWSAKLLSLRIEQHEGLPVTLKKDKKRLNDPAYSPRYVVGGSAKTSPVAVWWGARWAK